MSSDGYTYLIKVDTNGNAVLPGLAKNARQADTSLRKAGANGKRSFDKTGLSIGRARDEMGRFTSSGKRGFASINRGAARTNSLLGKTRGLIAGLGLTLTTGALATGLIGTGAGFEKSMSNVQALADSTKTELVTLSDAARDAGATTAYSARQSADAMGYLAQAGYKTTQMVDALPATLSLAAAGSIELSRSADIATNVLSQFRMKASETNVVVDQMAFTQSNFNTNIEEMADAMNYWGPSAAALKIGLSESNATIGLLANNGLKGSLATRALGSSIVRLTNPTKQMSNVMEDLNLKFFDSEGRFVGVAGMVETLNGNLQGLTDKQRQAALSTLFGAEAIQEINILLSEGSERIRDWTGKLDNAEGAARRMANTKLDNLSGDFQILKSTTQEVSLQMYESIGPTLRALTQEATLFMRNMDVSQVSLGMQKFFLHLRSGFIWLRRHKDDIVKLGKAYLTLRVGMLAYNAGMSVSQSITSAATLSKFAYARATRGAAVAQRSFNVALRANPLGAVLGVVTAVASAMALFRDRTKEATEAQQKLNLEKIQNKIFKEETKDLLPATNKDIEKLTLENINDRQLKRIRQDALLRKEKAEDALLELKAKAKSSDEYKEYRSLINKQGQDPTSLSRQEFMRIGELKEQINNMPLTVAGLSLSQINDVIKKNEGIIKQVSLLAPKDQSENALGTSSAVGTKPEPSTASEMSERVVSGGTSQRVVNVNLGKFFEDMVFNVADGNEIAGRMDDMKDQFMEMFMRVLNSANQIQNG